jgi:hypothetical protein
MCRILKNRRNWCVCDWTGLRAPSVARDVHAVMMATQDRTSAAALTGYLHPAYANCFSEWGDPVQLSGSGGWILTRSIPGVSERDAMGCYPIFCCEQWTRLRDDLANTKDLVSVALVTDPFGNYDPGVLRESFPDLAVPFKEHFVVDLAEDPHRFISQHHRRNTARALRSVLVTHCEDPTQHSEEWTLLYRHLIDRHSLRGLTAFSERSLQEQLRVPGLEMFRATVQGEPAGMILWMVQADIGYYHLGAFTDAGYREGASFALFWTSLEWFARKKLRWLSLGAGAGLHATPSGLTRFKRGWSTGTRMTYLCGRILRPEAYALLTARAGRAPDGYFPSYRRNEFG